MDRAGFPAPRPFVRPPTRGGDMPPPDHKVRIRDGEREIEVSGNPAFVRQVLDDLPLLMARLRGEAPGRTTISMPAPPDSRGHGAVGTPAAPIAATDGAVPIGDVATAVLPADGNGRATGKRTQPSSAAPSSLEERIFAVLRATDRPLAVAAIRQRIDGEPVTGQQVRRLLERAGEQVLVSNDRPATYSLR